MNSEFRLIEEHEMLKLMVEDLTDKYVIEEHKNFFKHIEYELTREEFDKEVAEHDLNDWIPIYCYIKQLNEKDYRNGLWFRYCGVGSIPKLGL